MRGVLVGVVAVAPAARQGECGECGVNRGAWPPHAGSERPSSPSPATYIPAYLLYYGTPSVPS